MFHFLNKMKCKDDTWGIRKILSHCLFMSTTRNKHIFFIQNIKKLSDACALQTFPKVTPRVMSTWVLNLPKIKQLCQTLWIFIKALYYKNLVATDRQTDNKWFCRDLGSKGHEEIREKTISKFFTKPISSFRKCKNK